MKKLLLLLLLAPSFISSVQMDKIICELIHCCLQECSVCYENYKSESNKLTEETKSESNKLTKETKTAVSEQPHLVEFSEQPHLVEYRGTTLKRTETLHQLQQDDSPTGQLLRILKKNRDGLWFKSSR